MKETGLAEIVRYCDRLLRVKTIKDYEGALNGLQVENRGRVRRLGAAVDASLATIQLAAGAGADFLVVHHGLFWSGRQPWTGSNYRLVKMLLKNDLAVYSMHLPLDMHPQLGNNAQLAAALGFKRLKPFFHFQEQLIGLKTKAALSREALAKKVGQLIGFPPHVIPAGPAICRCIGIVSGGAGGDLKMAAQEGVDTFLTGEGPHWTFAAAEELGINVLYAGHYATETFGVKALAGHLSRKFNLPWIFIDHPTGL